MSAGDRARPQSPSGITTILQRLGAGLSRLSERYIPDAWIICLILTLIVFGLAWVGPGAGPLIAARAWGEGVWMPLTLAMQFTLALVAAHACATAAPVHRALDWLARRPNPTNPRQAVLLVGLFSLLTGWLNWALSLVACALFVPFVLCRNPQADVRVVLAAGYLGLGTVWHGGLSGSAPLILATPGNPLLGTGGAPDAPPESTSSRPTARTCLSPPSTGRPAAGGWQCWRGRRTARRSSVPDRSVAARRTTLLAYCYGDSTTNLIQPFFAIPPLGGMRVRFADILGYTAIVAAVCLVINMIAMLVIPRTL